MSTYTPDRWVMLKFSSEEHGDVYKVLASWYGGYAGSDSWKLSSGVVSIKAGVKYHNQKHWDDKLEQELEVKDVAYHYYDMLQSSGSTYRCYKDSYGMSGYTAGVFGDFEEQVSKMTDGTTLTIMDENFDIASIAEL